MTEWSPIPQDEDETVRPGEAAALLRVTTHTVRRYELNGLLRSVRTPGGHRRYYRSEVLALRDHAQAGT